MEIDITCQYKLLIILLEGKVSCPSLFSFCLSALPLPPLLLHPHGILLFSHVEFTCYTKLFALF